MDPVALATQLLAEVRDDLRKADNKASVVLGTAGIIASALAAGLLAGSFRPSQMDNSTALALFALGTLALVGCLCCAGWAVYPRMRNLDTPIGRVHYFGDTTELKLDEITAAIEETAKNGELHRTTEQFAANSQIVREKYTWIQRAMQLMLVAATLIAAAGLIEIS